MSELFANQCIDHARSTCGVIGCVTIDQHINVGIDIGEHAPDHVSLALAAFPAHHCAGGACNLDGASFRVVCRRQRSSPSAAPAKVGDYRCDGGFLVEGRAQNSNPQRWL